MLFILILVTSEFVTALVCSAQQCDKLLVIKHTNGKAALKLDKWPTLSLFGVGYMDTTNFCFKGMQYHQKPYN